MEEWKLLKKDSFEYEKVFEPVSSVRDWWKQESTIGKQMEWFLEGPTKYGWTTTNRAHLGNRSACLRTEIDKRAILVAGDFETWNVPKKGMSFWFLLPEGKYDKSREAIIWINVDLVDYQKEVWLNACPGVNRLGDLFYFGDGKGTAMIRDVSSYRVGDGYGRTQDMRPLRYFNGDFALDYNKWYKMELYADFDKFGSTEGMLMKLHTEEKTFEWTLPLNSWSDQDWKEYRKVGLPFFEFSFGAYYFGISTKTISEAYFDDVECYIGT